MALIVVLIVLAIQRLLKFNSYSHHFDWATHYFEWLSNKVKPITTGHGFVGLTVLVAPIILVAAIIFGLVYSLFGTVGHAILSVALVWYCLDGRDIRKEPYDNATPSTLLLNSYGHLFAILFWYCLCGPVGLVLYVSVVEISAVLPQPIITKSEEGEEQTQQNQSWPDYLRKIL